MDMFKQAFLILEEIGATSSRLRKEVLLQDGKDNAVLKRLLWETYNNFRVFGVKKTPPVTTSFRKDDGDDLKAQAVWDKYIDILGRLCRRELTGNTALEALHDIFSQCTETEYKWYLKVLQKDLKIGITDKTVNKVFKGFIPTFSAMLAEPFKKSPKLPKNFCMDPKLDGYRCLAFHHTDGTVQLLTRNGNLLVGYEGIEADITRLPAGYVYDGEILGEGNTFNSVQKAAFKKVSGKKGILHIFDALPIDEFDKGGGTIPYHIRLNFLQAHKGEVSTCPSLSLVEHSRWFTNDAAGELAVTEYHKKYTDAGYEGTMIKDGDAPYVCKRTKGIMKVKDMDNIDLVVVAVEEGEAGTDREGMLGALVVEYEGNTVNVGSGYSREQCQDFWARKAELINKTIEIQYQESTVNKKGQKSLRFPVFVKFRDDK